MKSGWYDLVLTGAANYLLILRCLMFFCNFYTDSKKCTNQTRKYYMATARKYEE